MVQIRNKLLILIDGSFYLHRAYHALPSLTNSIGEPTGAVYGALNTLYSLILQYHPTHVAVVFDVKGINFRNVLYKRYKSHRPSMPNELQIQIKLFQVIIKAMGFSSIAVSGFEADDIIGTLSLEAEKKGYTVLISTGDKDMAQLVTSKIKLINTETNSIFGQKEVLDKYGVHPKLMTDFLALVGDSSDNIPGVPGIGKKTAQTLLQDFGELNTIYDKLEKISTMTFRRAKTIAKSLEENKELAYLSYQLAKIKTNVKLQFTFEQLKIQQPVIEKLLKIFEKYEFKRWIADIKNGKLLQL